MPRTTIHRESQPTDPAFLREHLTRDIERARSLAAQAGIRIDGDGSTQNGHREERLLSLIGVGDRFCRDDAAGLEVVRRLRLAHPPGLMLIEREELAWQGDQRS